MALYALVEATKQEVPPHRLSFAQLEIVSCQMYLPMPGFSATTADFFHPLVRHIETMVLENRAPYPIERTWLTSGMTIAAVESIHKSYTLVNTPEMEVVYKAPKESLFWRE